MWILFFCVASLCGMNVMAGNDAATAVKLDSVLAYVNKIPIFQSDLDIMVHILTESAKSSQNVNIPKNKDLQREAFKQLIDLWVWRGVYARNLVEQQVPPSQRAFIDPDLAFKFYIDQRQQIWEYIKKAEEFKKFQPLIPIGEDTAYVGLFIYELNLIQQFKLEYVQTQLRTLSNFNPIEREAAVRKARLQYEQAQNYDLDIWKIELDSTTTSDQTEKTVAAWKALLESDTALEVLQAQYPSCTHEQVMLSSSELPDPYEKALKNTELGKLTEPVPIGRHYHILRLKSKTISPKDALIQSYAQEYHVRWIKKTATPVLLGATIQQDLAEYREKILSGEKRFESIAQAYSDDYKTQNVGGDLGWVGRGSDIRSQAIFGPHWQTILGTIFGLQAHTTISEIVEVEPGRSWAVFEIVERRSRDSEAVINQIASEELLRLEDPQILNQRMVRLIGESSEYFQKKAVISILSPELKASVSVSG